MNMLEKMAREAFKKYTNSHSNVVVVDETCGGKPHIRGSKVTVDEVLKVFKEESNPYEKAQESLKITSAEIEGVFDYMIGLINSAFK